MIDTNKLEDYNKSIAIANFITNVSITLCVLHGAFLFYKIYASQSFKSMIVDIIVILCYIGYITYFSKVSENTEKKKKRYIEKNKIYAVSRKNYDTHKEYR